MFRSLIALAALTLSACATVPRAATLADEVRPPVTILISIDGFRPDYLGRGDTPMLDGLAADGASGTMRPSFPTKTFPNHWALVTGKHPDRNGIVANRFEDTRRPGETFTMQSDDPFWWNEASPIWVEAEKAGVRTATMFWPGSNVAWGGDRAGSFPNSVVGGTRPQDWQQFNQVMSGTQRVNTVLDWLRRPASIRPRFVTLYFDTVDSAGHRFGPDSPETRAAVREVDEHIAVLAVILGEEFGQPVNFVIVSDHGMQALDPAKVVALDKVIAATDARIIENGPYASFEALPGREAATAAALLKPHPHMVCWRRANIPARLAWGRNPRVPSFVCLGESGWSLLPTAPAEPIRGGNHGWDNAEPNMAALIIASGPSIRRGAPVRDADSVDVYPLLARLLGVVPLPGDGDAALADALVARK